METNRIKPEEYIGAFHSQEEMGFSTTVPDMKMYAALPNLQMLDIVKFHQERVSGKPYTLAVVADRNRVTNSDLSRYGKVTELTLEQIFGYWCSDLNYRAENSWFFNLWSSKRAFSESGVKWCCIACKCLSWCISVQAKSYKPFLSKWWATFCTSLP